MSTRCHLIYHPTDEHFEAWWDINDDSVHVEAGVKELNAFAQWNGADVPMHHVVRMKLPPHASKLMRSVLKAHEKIKRLKIDLDKNVREGKEGAPRPERIAHVCSWNDAIDAALAVLTAEPRSADWERHKTRDDV